MESRRLIFWGLAVACFGLSDARVLSLSVPTYWDAEVRKPALMEDVAGGGAHPERDHSRQPAQKPGSPQGYLIQPAAEKFPQGPDPPVQQQSVKTDRLALRCRDNHVQVEVKQDLMGTGRLAKPEEVTLGGCPPTEVDNWGRVLAFESELHRCGSVLTMKDNTFVYAFNLTYKPREISGTPITRGQSAVIGVECHYLRRLRLDPEQPTTWLKFNRKVE